MMQEPYHVFGIMYLDIEGSSIADPRVAERFNSDEFEGFFPASGFRLESSNCPNNLIIHDLKQFDWEDQELTFDGVASWDVEVQIDEYTQKPTDQNLVDFIQRYHATWRQASCYLSHNNYPGVKFVGYFAEGPESDGPSS